MILSNACVEPALEPASSLVLSASIAYRNFGSRHEFVILCEKKKHLRLLKVHLVEIVFD